MSTARTAATSTSASGIDAAMIEAIEEDTPILEMPTLVKMKFQKYNVISTLHELLEMFLYRLQVAVPDVCFGPVDDEDCLLPRLSNSNDLPKDDTTLEKYLKDVKVTHNGYGFARIKIHSNRELYEIEAQTASLHFPGKIQISLEYWPLQTVSPVNVGFAYNNIPRKETMMMHQRRLEKMLEKKYKIFNRFQLSIQTLCAGNGRKRCYVIMIKSSEDDAKILNETLLQINESEDLSYCSWDKFMKLDDTERLELVEDQKLFSFSLRSLIIPGFIDNDDDIPMVYYKDDDEPDRNETTPNPLEKIGITEYLLRHVQSGREVPLFEYVYPPALGKREVVVTKQHYSEALNFIRRCHGELARSMNDRAILNCFQDPQTARNGSLEKPWIGFQMWKKIPEAIIPESRKKRPTKPTKKPGICFGKATSVTAEPRNEPCIRANVVTTAVDVSVIADESKVHPHDNKLYDELVKKVNDQEEEMQKLLEIVMSVHRVNVKLGEDMDQIQSERRQEKETIMNFYHLTEIMSQTLVKQDLHTEKRFAELKEEFDLVKHNFCVLLAATVGAPPNFNTKGNNRNKAK